MSEKNPKLEGTNIIDCIPQTSYCPMKCTECFYNNGFYRTLDEPLLPSLEDAEGKIVRINSGHDSNINRALVLSKTEQYKQKFYNTSNPQFFFPAPVVFTCNQEEDSMGREDFLWSANQLYVENIMFVRFRVNTWNLNACDDAVEIFTGKNIPVVLTFMRYKLYENVREIENYYYKKHIINSYWLIKEDAFYSIVNRYKNNNLVYVCGSKVYGKSTCKDCLNCETLYWKKKNNK